MIVGGADVLPVLLGEATRAAEESDDEPDADHRAELAHRG
jgi:hypothetical protein